MRSLIIFIISAPVFVSVFFSSTAAKPVIAFGYMHNIKSDLESDYLELILPNSFANSVNAIFDVNVKKTLQLEKELREKGSTLKKDYELYELPELIKEIESDLFVFGSFEPYPRNQIKMILNIYMHGYNEIFTFTNIGRMETQISKLVDRISIVIINFMSEHSLYKVRKIQPGTRLAVLTNLEGEEQNRLLIAFLMNGYPVTFFQVNELHNIVDDFTIKRFSYISTMKNSYDTVSDWRRSTFYFSTWTGERYKESVDYIRSIYKKYDLDYELLKNDTLERINNAFDQRIDVLLIIGFSPDRTVSWVRALDMKEKELIWMQSNIKSDILTLDKITNNAKKILTGMTAEPVNPFKKPVGSSGVN